MTNILKQRFNHSSMFNETSEIQINIYDIVSMLLKHFCLYHYVCIMIEKKSKF